MAKAQKIHACACLNVRVNVQDTAEERTTLEDIENVLECTLDSSAIRIELSALVEVVPGSSIDRKISAVRCLLCRSHVAYFKSPSPSSQTAAIPHASSGHRQMPAPFTTVYLPKSTKDPEEVRKSMEKAEYSQPFGVLLQPAFVDVARPRHSVHIPREMQQKSAEFMQRQETDKNERVRDFIRTQDEELERIHRRTTDECSILAEIIGKAHPQSPVTTQPVEQARTGSSGLAAMLRGSSAGVSGPNPSSRAMAGSLGGSIPFATLPARGAISRPGIGGGGGGGGGGDLFDDDLDDSGSRNNFSNTHSGHVDGSSSGIGRQIGSQQTPSRQSAGYSDDLEQEEHEFGDFDDDNGGSGVRAARDSPSLAVPLAHQQMSGSGNNNNNTNQVVAGSMPIQIPRFGSSSLAVGGYSMNRQEYQQRADEMDMSRRREQILRGLPKTFVPPHELMNQIHDNDVDMLLIGSKPRDSYGIGRRHAPG
ncbi:hypothetical protein IW140_003709 [Coemansia sp. RSA 1813]|nr:hypothetical protein LPJ74_004958 [Coemansia sp. RSA 1843]KAJ2213668.1 hypothetical protein EV179_003668 [Coemansia sp. RSA 487]KAJ2568615.1 hypothetical protein IW140_003709 [Coemansia sp. RSA 1813]